MIKDIEISNFRCFEANKFSGFERVNLISGKNNAGKTALLEALLLNSSPHPDNVILLKQIRKESLEFSKSLPERAWNNLFFNQNKKEEIAIITRNEEGSINLVKISVDESVKKITEEYDNEHDLEDFMTLFSSSKSLTSVLNLKIQVNNQDSFYGSLVANSKGILTQEPKIFKVINVFFIPSFLRSSNRVLAEEYDKAYLKNKTSEILEAFRIIDSSINEVQSISIGEPTIYLKRDGENRLPLSLFGDALNRIADIILSLVNNQSSILLIDEIENGIHYTNQRELWNILFRLADELDAQIFATTHSLEMIQAFVDVGIQQYEGLGAHFELARHAKTNQIIGIKRDLETLDYGIKHQKGVRGE
ncbi:MAG: ATP-binding protein [Symploca sp. SIO2G7]|nr:ATP-binding protein [Symploca sp. SIO2G7]